MAEDYAKANPNNERIVQDQVLRGIQKFLENNHKKLRDCDLPNIVGTNPIEPTIPFIVQEELSTKTLKDDISSIQLLNFQQKLAYDRILYAVYNDKPYVFFIDGPRGTGKTFLYKALLATTRTNAHIALATTSSRIAGTNLPGGKIAHSRFKIPLRSDACYFCDISKQSDLATLIRQTKIIIWDEAPVTTKFAFEAVDRILQDIMHFGGKIVVLGGDFRKILSVVPCGTRSEIMEVTLIRSYI
ncbi:hypothetical protein AMTRI_Chr04g185000 [Amborella trichopoda]